MAAIAKKRLRKEMSLCQILEILSVTIFEKKPILLVFSQCNDASSNLEHAIHMNLLELFWDSTVKKTRIYGIAMQSCSAFWNYSAAFILPQHPQHAMTHLRPITIFRTAE